MESTFTPLSVRRSWPAVAGPAAIAAAVQFSAYGRSGQSISMGVVLVSVVTMTLPALYVGAALAGVGPSAAHLARSVQDALTRTGIIWLGLAPALAFLAATSTSIDGIQIVTRVVLGIGAVFAFQALYKTAFKSAPHRIRAFVLFSIWALVAFGLGLRLQSTLMAG